MKKTTVLRRSNATATTGTNFRAIRLKTGQFLKHVSAINNTSYRPIYLYLVNANQTKPGVITGNAPEFNWQLRDKSHSYAHPRSHIWRGCIEIPEGDWYVESQFFDCVSGDAIGILVAVSNFPGIDSGESNESKAVKSAPGGTLVQSVTSVVVVNNTAKTLDTVVPAGERWILLSVKLTNPDDVNRPVWLHKFKEAGKTNMLAKLAIVTSVGALADNNWPTAPTISTSRMIAANPSEILEAGNTLESYWGAGGASTGGTSADGLVIEYLKVPQ